MAVLFCAEFMSPLVYPLWILRFLQWAIGQRSFFFPRPFTKTFPPHKKEWRTTPSFWHSERVLFVSTDSNCTCLSVLVHDAVKVNTYGSPLSGSCLFAGTFLLGSGPFFYTLYGPFLSLFQNQETGVTLNTILGLLWIGLLIAGISLAASDPSDERVRKKNSKKVYPLDGEHDQEGGRKEEQEEEQEETTQYCHVCQTRV